MCRPCGAGARCATLRTGAAWADERGDRARERPEGYSSKDRHISRRIREMHINKLHDALRECGASRRRVQRMRRRQTHAFSAQSCATGECACALRVI